MAKKVNALPRIADYCDIDIRRCNASGTDDPKGTYVRIAKLQVHLDSQFDVSTHVGMVGIKLSTEQGYRNINKTTACGSGYTEVKPALFTEQFSADKNYVFNISVSMSPAYAYSLTSLQQNYTLSSSKCLMDFSPSGSVSIGSFVSEGNGVRPDPRFEVGSNLKAYFLGGIEGVTNLAGGEAVATGGTTRGLSKNAKIYRYVFESADAIADNSDARCNANDPNTGDRVPISIHGAADLSSGNVVPLPYFYSASEYIGIRIGPAGN